MTAEASAPPIVLIHGLWLTPRSWDGWKERFESRGHQVLAPAWPRMQEEVEDVRRDPSQAPGWEEVADYALEWATSHAGATGGEKAAATA
jgi:pimeloyl-ACP methyl ester carboxylesterase